jgi:Protein of unknown function with HXXEE motif
MLSWYRRNWYWVGGIVAAAVLVYVAVAWGDLSVLRRVLLLNFALLAIHEFEEYGWPGGEPAIMNKALQPSATPDRYPINQNSGMIVNVVAAYPFLLAPAIFTGQIWLGLAGVLFWVGQFVVHGILTNAKFKTVYNPGMLSTLVGLGLLVYYAYYVESNDLASVWDWVGGVAAMAAFAFVVLLKMGYGWLADENSPYPFTEAEMRRWNVDARLARLAAADVSENAGGSA